MAYSADRKPGELTALTVLATDDVFVVGDTSDVSEVAKGITKANLLTDLGSTFAPVLGADDNYVTDAEKVVIGNTSGTNTGDNAVNSNYSGLVSNATHTGDVTGATALTIANDAVTNAKLANVATNTIKGRVTAATGDPEDLTAAQVRSLLNVADGATANAGTVTSVAVSGSDGIEVDSGSPVTSSGTIALGVNKTNMLTHLNVEDGAQVNTVTATNTVTLTNKRVSERLATEASSATPTINTDTTDYYSLTALATNVTSFTTNLSGTPTKGQKLIIEVTPTATRTVTWGASFEDGNVHTLPTEFTGTTTVQLGFMWNSITSKWRLVALDA